MVKSSQTSKLYFLALLLVLLLAIIVYRVLKPAPPIPVAAAPAPQSTDNRVQVQDDDILSVELIDVNFWEARFRVRYQQKKARSGGYLAVEHHRWTPNVGLITSPGLHEGVTLLTRHLGERDAYSIDEVVTRMYNPYRQDKNFAKKVFPIDLNWPSRNEIPTFDADKVDDVLSQIGQLVIYRNVPDYVGFAEKLTAKGFPPEKINMMLAICPNCAGSLIYGKGVRFEQLQAVLAALKEHDFPLKTVSFSDDPAAVQQIQIGNSPLKDGKPLWANIDALLSAESDEEFFKSLGFPLQSPETRARQLLAEARKLINQNNRMEHARQLLDQALLLDDSYVPIYLEMARHVMRTQTFSEAYINEDVLLTAEKAEQLIRAGLTVDSEYADAYVLLGYVLAIKRDFDNAEVAFNKAEELGTTNQWLHYNRALMFIHENKVDEAIAQYKKYLSSTPAGDDNDRPIRLGLNRLANIYLRQGKVDDAFGVFEYTLEQFPSDYRTISQYLSLLAAHGGDPQRIEALLHKCKSCSKWIEPHIRSMQALLNAAELLEEDKDSAQRAVIRAQAFRGDFLVVTADLMKGETGRNAVEKLVVNSLIDIPSLERTGSLALYLVDEYSTSALDLALTMGADPNLVKGRSAMSPLMQAVAHQRPDMIEVLLIHGGDPNMENSYGLSAMQLAQSLENQLIIAKLEAGANRI